MGASPGREWKGAPWGLIALALVSVGCGSRIDDEAGGESHFLSACETTCDRGLTCIDQVCTRECSDHDDCKGLASNAVCVDAPEGPVCNVESAAPCEEGGLNHERGDSWQCSDGCNTCNCTESGVVSTGIFCPSTCEEGGKTHVAGETWPCSDGCNTCTCTEDGLQQTMRVCPDGAVSTCEDDGQTYHLGDTWTCSDSCHTCSCGEGGDISRTDEECPQLVVCSWNGDDYQLGDLVELGTGVTCVCLETGEIGLCTGANVDGGSSTSSEDTSGSCSYGDQEYASGEVVELGTGATCICLDTGLLGQCTGAIAEPDGGGATVGGSAPDSVVDICQLPPDSGDCLAAEPAVYFDPQSGQCLQFIYGGCGGNGNRFDSTSACYAACRKDGG